MTSSRGAVLAPIPQPPTKPVVGNTFVLDCGNRDWISTYQAIPALIDTELAAHGATRVHPRGEGDARDDFDGQFRAWYGTLWTDLAHALDLPTVDTDGQIARGHRYEVEVLAGEPAAPLAATYNATTFPILENRELYRRDGPEPSPRSTRHLTLTVPDGRSYRTGDYLGVVPRNHPDLVKWVRARFALPFNIFLELLSPLRPRYYSISSSALADPKHCTATVGVVEGPARSGQGTYHGACSCYLATRDAGTTVSALIQAPSTPVRPPADPLTPVIMVGPGTDVAPFRGFLHERAALADQGAALGPALLFFGCRDPNQDFIYQDELEDFAARGIVSLHVAFSRAAGRPKTYVQDEIKAQAAEVWRLLEAGAVIYVCGDASKMAPDVRRAFATVYRARTGAVDAAADAWLNELQASGRYIADVWAA